MTIRFEPATQEAMELLDEIRKKHFPELWEAKVLVLFDNKKNMRMGRVVLAKIQKTNDLLRLLTQDDEVGQADGYDYIITVDRKFWDSTGREDHVRVLRHELRHAYFDYESEFDSFKLVGHDFEDFRAEVVLNADDSDWAQRCVTLVSDLYEQEKEQKKEGKKLDKPRTIGDRVNVRRNTRLR